MKITPEEKAKIYEEERARYEAREQIKNESPEALRAKGKKQMMSGCIQIIIGLILLAISAFCFLSLFVK